VKLTDRRDAIAQILKAAQPIVLEGYSPVPGNDPGRREFLGTTAKSGPKDLVTLYDKRVEEFILDKMSRAFPGEVVLGEESVAKFGGNHAEAVHEILKTTDHFWVVDPIDGTTNFARAYPFFCSTACFFEKKGEQLEPTACATFDPLHEEMFTASKGGGAWLNRQRLSTTKISEPMHSLLCTGFASRRSFTEERSFALFEKLTRQTLGVRRDGSAALDLAYVAAGRMDAYWEWSLSIWDTAAGALLVRESGGEVTHLDGGSWDPLTGEILSTNGPLHKWVLDQLKG
jgi:myo-inositol-1(or 4)-monophosphatase